MDGLALARRGALQLTIWSSLFLKLTNIETNWTDEQSEVHHFETAHIGDESYTCAVEIMFAETGNHVALPSFDASGQKKSISGHGISRVTN
jgi:hypothetical protein